MPIAELAIAQQREMSEKIDKRLQISDRATAPQQD